MLTRFFRSRNKVPITPTSKIDHDTFCCFSHLWGFQAPSNMKWVFLFALLVPLALAQTTADDDDDDRDSMLKLISKYPEVKKVNLKKLWGDAPELKVTIIFKNEECGTDADPSAPVNNSCATNPKRDCSCFEEKLKTHKWGFHEKIQPLSDGPEFEVFCSHTDGKLWTVIEDRLDSSANELGADGFNRNFADYEKGFGSLTGNHFIGLKNIHALTQAADMRLMIEMTNEDYDFRNGQFSTFKVAGPSDNYELTIGGHSGVLGSSIVADSNGQPFSAKDKDNGGKGCPAKAKAGWWFSDEENACGTCNLNGPMNSDLFACDTSKGNEKGTAVTFYVTPNDYLQS